MAAGKEEKKPRKTSAIRFRGIIILEILILLILFGAFRLINKPDKDPDSADYTGSSENDKKEQTNGAPGADDAEGEEEKLTEEELEAIREQEKLKKEIGDRENLIIQAESLVLGYDYDGAMELIKSYQGEEGGYEIYPTLVAAVTDIETRKAGLLLYGGSYTTVRQFNHIFFHSLIADNSRAFDGDEDSTGYNMYMTTVNEFKNMMQTMYDDGYVLVSIHDIAKEVTKEDGTTEFMEQEIYLPEGKKPFVLSQDDVSYYGYMEGDGFATRIVVGEDGKPTCEMILKDGSVVTGSYDMVPIIDDFVEEHPDFSYRGAKGIIALTGYEGVLGYRTDDPTSPTYAQDVETAKAVAEAMKADGWEFASHSWGHRNMQERSFNAVQVDAQRWMDEVSPIIGPTDILIFPNGVDIETTMGHYSSDKFQYLKEMGFDYYCGVYQEPWMHIKADYVRMTRRPLDGQAMLQFPERLADLFDLTTIIDPERPPKDW